MEKQDFKNQESSNRKEALHTDFYFFPSQFKY